MKTLHDRLEEAASKKKKRAGKAKGGVDDRALNDAQLAEKIEEVTDNPDFQDDSIDQADPLSSDFQMGDAMDGEMGGDLEDASITTRQVKGAHLVYKRQTDVDGYEELWIYEIDPINPRSVEPIEVAILAATDIDPKRMADDEGKQRAETWIAGNAKMMKLTGLVN